MARARNIKPGFFSNEDLAECSPWARLCFIGLWTLADRDGLLEDRPKRIKGELFRFDSVEVDPLLTELSRFGFIVRYEVDGQRLIQIPKFTEHQTPHYSEKPSGIKPPPFMKDSEKNPGEESPSTPKDSENIPENSRSTPGVDASLRGGRNHLNPDSLNPDSLNPDSSPKPPRGGRVHDFPPGFERLWAAYPRKVAKDAAAKAFAKRKPDEALLELMLRAVAAQRQSREWTKDGGQYVPHLATWLNQGRWMDDAGGSAPVDDIFAGAK